MGMYTELIFGAALEKATPNIVIESLQYMMGMGTKPENFPLPEGRCEGLFRGSSYYFGVNGPVNKMWKDHGSWVVCTRSNIKNYGREIEAFLNWIEPYISKGSGIRGMYAIVTYEEGDPEIYYLRKGEEA
jgi:hypothetical protein